MAGRQESSWARLRDRIDRGETGEKIAASDPAAAPLGTDDEAAGVPMPPADVARSDAPSGASQSRRSMPRDSKFDSTLDLLSEGYLFISNRCRRHRSDVFATRLMLSPAICALGAEAAEMFYAAGRFTRQGALPITTVKLLTDKGSVQQLDGSDHRRRKDMFLGLMTPGSIRRLCDDVVAVWHAQLNEWQAKSEVVLLEAMHEVLCRAVCAWARVPLAEDDVRQRSRELATMVDGAGAIGPYNWYALLLRRSTENWIGDMVEGARAGRPEAPAGSALRVVADYRTAEGRQLEPSVAAVELINLLRPTVAIARFVTFAALALHEHPEWHDRLVTAGDAELEMFVQEVRRYYPFFPMVGGLVREPFTWRGHHFDEKDWVLLDLYGTDHDPRSWPEPDRFWPGRFRDRVITAFDLVPQGAGRHATTHRCPGEWITIEIMKTVTRLLVADTDYDVPAQDLTISFSKMPTGPASGFVMTNVRKAA